MNTEVATEPFKDANAREIPSRHEANAVSTICIQCKGS